VKITKNVRNIVSGVTKVHQNIERYFAGVWKWTLYMNGMRCVGVGWHWFCFFFNIHVYVSLFCDLVVNLLCTHIITR